MKSITKKLLLVSLLFVGFGAQPLMAQTWTKVAKETSKQAQKAISKKSAQKATKTISKNASRPSSSTSQSRPSQNTGTYNPGSSAARTASQYKQVTCSACSGRGWYVYNGYRYTCQYCSGRGYNIVQR